MTTKQGSTKQRVKHLLSLDQRFRDNDRDLILKLWEEFGLILTKEQRAIYMSAPSADVIVRRRREFTKDFPPSHAAQERRYRHYKDMTAEFSPQSWLQRLLKKKGVI